MTANIPHLLAVSIVLYGGSMLWAQSQQQQSGPTAEPTASFTCDLSGEDDHVCGCIDLVFVLERPGV